jgi:hypothetical protein
MATTKATYRAQGDTPMTKQEIHQAIYDACSQISRSVSPYSGRGMYGKECLALVCLHPLATAIDIAAEMAPSMLEAALPTLREARIDSLGTGMVMYWPQIEWQADWSEGEDKE